MEIQQIETSELTDKQQQLTMFYDSLDEDTANYLKAKEYRIVQIGNSYLTELGKEFKEAQDRRITICLRLYNVRRYHSSSKAKPH